MDSVVIYTDGSSKGNPGPGGWGVIVATQSHVEELGGGEENTTNNRMELQAAFEALKFLNPQKVESIIFRADSAYVVNGATMWKWGWLKNGWKTKEGKDVMNADIWKPFVKILQPFEKKIRWENVGGHVEIPGNERVDAIANAYALDTKVELYSGPRSGYAIDLESVTVNEEKQSKKKSSRTKSKLKAYSYVSEVDGKIEIHKTWDECEKRVRGKKARYKKAVSQEDERKIILEFSRPKN
jgi:ribonuclease HI